MKKLKTKLSAFLLSTVMAVSLLSGATAMSKVQAAGTVADVIALAQSQVGYHEKASNYNLDSFTANSGSANYNKYARDVGVSNGQAWCATFVWWLMQSSGVPSSAYPSRTTVTRDWFRQRGLYHERGGYTPKAGDYVIFGDVEHCGIVESVSGNYVYTIEGNSSDQVKRNCYSLSNTYILGYGEIAYNPTTTPEPSGFDGIIRVANPGSPYPVPTGILRSGSSGDAVRWIQKFANDIMGAGISVDGVYGNQTIYAVKVFQQQNGLTVDGIAGSQTISKMLSVWQNKTTIKPLNLGDEFAAIILRTDIWKSIRNDGSNITLWDEKANAQYYWCFTRQGDGSYIIKSLYDGKAMDVHGSAAISGSNVYTYAEHGLNNQRWYIYGSGNSYRIVSKLGSNMSLDVAYAGTANGTNIQLHESNDSVAQRFSIYKISHSALKSVDIASGYSKTMTIGDKQTLKYSLSPSTTRCNMVKWVSSDSSVLSVDGNGVLTAKKAGTATITCVSTYSGTIKDAVTIEVKKKEEVTTEKLTTEAPKTEVTTEKETTEAPKTEVTTEQQPETPKTEVTTEQQPEAPKTEVTTEQQPESAETEVPTTQLTETDDATGDEDSEEYEEIDDFDDEDDWDMAEDDSVGVGSILTDTKNKCQVEVTCDVEGALTVDYLGTTQKKAKSITVPNSVTIDGNTYSVTGIADDAFSDETTLTKVTIGSNVQWIGDSAFRNCKKLKSIVIPKSVKTIGKNAFRNCKALKKITIKGTALTSIGKNAFKGVPKKATLVLPKSKIKEYKKLLKKGGLK